MEDRKLNKFSAGVNKFISDSPELKVIGLTVSFKLVDQAANDVYPFVAATFDTEANCYTAEITIEDVKMNSTYFRGIWKALKDSTAIPISNYLINYEYINQDQMEVELVPVPYFTEYGLRVEVDSRLRASIRKATDESLRAILWAATSDLGLALKTTLYPKLYTQEKRDQFNEGYVDTYWMIQPNHQPIVEIIKYELYYSDQKIMELDPAQHLLIDKEMGMVEFLPTSVRGIEFYSRFINAVAAISGFSSNRIPGFFRLTYKAGIDFFKLERADQESIRQAICRHAMLFNLGRLDPNVYGGSISKSIDGASKSVSYSGMPWLQQQAGIQNVWLADKRRDLGTEWAISIA